MELAAQHAVVFATRAKQHDRDGTFPFENFQELQSTGVMASVVPREYGGLGVESLHDLMVGMNRLGRGDASTAIAANMHIAGGYCRRFEAVDRRRAARSKVAFVGFLTGMTSEVDLVTFMGKCARVEAVDVGSREMFETMNKSIEFHAMQPVIDRVFGFTELRDALKYLSEGRHFGKVCLRP